METDVRRGLERLTLLKTGVVEDEFARNDR
jgi:hypothetical protein